MSDPTNELAKAYREVELWRKLFRIIGDFFRRLASGGLSLEEAGKELQTIIERRNPLATLSANECERLTAKALRYVDHRQYAKALSVYQRLAESDPHNQRFRLKIGDLALKLQDFDLAAQTYLNVAHMYRTNGFLTKAIAVFKQVTKIEPTTTGSIAVSQAYLELAETYLQMGMVQDAVFSWEDLAKYFVSKDMLMDALSVRIVIFQRTATEEARDKALELCVHVITIADAIAVQAFIAEAFPTVLFTDSFTSILMRLGAHMREGRFNEAKNEIVGFTNLVDVPDQDHFDANPVQPNSETIAHNDLESMISVLQRQLERTPKPLVHLLLAKLIYQRKTPESFDESWKHVEEVLRAVPSNRFGELRNNEVLKIFFETGTFKKYVILNKAKEHLGLAFAPELEPEFQAFEIFLME